MERPVSKRTLARRFKSRVVTVGDHSFLGIDMKGKPGHNVSLILESLRSFELFYPRLEITTWKIEKQQAALASLSEDFRSVGARSDFIFGLWIDHKPRKHE